jgi:hypothetical protein
MSGRFRAGEILTPQDAVWVAGYGTRFLVSQWTVL